MSIREGLKMGKARNARPGRTEKTRRRIMARAERVFQERGFRKVTVEELCADLGMSKRTFYRHFPDRDALVVAIIAERVEGVGPVMIENLTSSGPVDEILRKHFDLLMENMLSGVTTQFMVDVQVLMPEVWDRIDQFRSGFVGIITDLLCRGQREGSIRRDIDPPLAGKLMQVILTHVAHPRLLMEQGLSLDQFVATFKDLLLQGVLAPEQGYGEEPNPRHSRVRGNDGQ
jgi:AcrR family transcriptional regulator